MNTPPRSTRALRFSLLSAVVLWAIASAPGLRAQVNGAWNVDASGNWSDATNWTSDPLIPGGAGSTVNLTLDITTNVNVTVDGTSRTVGILNLGDPDSSHTVRLGNSGGATVIFNSGDANPAQLNLVGRFTVAMPLVLADDLIIHSDLAGNFGEIEQGVSGTGNLYIDNDGGDNGVRFNGGSINITGNIYNIGSGSGTNNHAQLNVSSIGSGVEQIVQQSATSSLRLQGTLNIHTGGTTTVVNTGGALVRPLGTTAGTGDLVLDNQTAVTNAIVLTEGTLNHTGRVINESAGSGQVQINNKGVGANITALVQESSTSLFEVRDASLNPGVNGLGFENNGGAVLRIVSDTGAGASGDITLSNNTAVDGGIRLDEKTWNHAGQIINEGTGSGSVIFASNSTIGANVTGIVQNSATSALDIRGVNNAYAGDTLITAGTLILADNAKFNFDIGASGDSNGVTVGAAGTFLVDGDFVFNLDLAAPVGSWTIVSFADISNVTYGSNFTVVDFTETAPNSGIWTLGDYTFTESTGLLTAVPEPSTIGLVCAGLGGIWMFRRRRTA